MLNAILRSLRKVIFRKLSFSSRKKLVLIGRGYSPLYCIQGAKQHLLRIATMLLFFIFSFIAIFGTSGDSVTLSELTILAITIISVWMIALDALNGHKPTQMFIVTYSVILISMLVDPSTSTRNNPVGHIALGLSFACITIVTIVVFNRLKILFSFVTERITTKFRICWFLASRIMYNTFREAFLIPLLRGVEGVKSGIYVNGILESCLQVKSY